MVRVLVVLLSSFSSFMSLTVNFLSLLLYSLSVWLFNISGKEAGYQCDIRVAPTTTVWQMFSSLSRPKCQFIVTLLGTGYRLLFYKSVLMCLYFYWLYIVMLLHFIFMCYAHFIFYLIVLDWNRKCRCKTNFYCYAIKDGKDQQLNPLSYRKQPQQTEVMAQTSLLFWDWTQWTLSVICPCCSGKDRNRAV